MNPNAPARRVARLEALCRRLGQPPDEDGIETYCGQMALITHDDLNKELEGPMVEARMAVWLHHWVDLAKKVPAELHPFRGYSLRGENQRGAHVQRRSHCRAGRAAAMIALRFS